MQIISEVQAVIAEFAGIPVEEVHAGRALGDYPIQNHFDADGKLPPISLDSYDRIELAMKLEDKFGIEITDDEVDCVALGHVGGLAAFVRGKVDAKG